MSGSARRAAKNGDTAGTVELPIRYAAVCRNYGPGMPLIDPEGVHEKILSKALGQIGVVSVHCWNLGEADGPYPFEPGTRAIGEPADWVPRAHEIIEKYIQPVMEAVRKCGVTVFHLGNEVYATRYKSYQEILRDPELQSPPRPDPPEFEGCVRPLGDEHHADVTGPNFPGAPWRTMPEKFDIARAVRPIDGEPVVMNGWQLNGLCRRLGIDTLFYMGFMANICLVDVPGSMKEMSQKFQYRCVALRECTTAHEFADTHEGFWMTHAAIRLVEQQFGYSASAVDLLRSLTSSTRR